MPASNITLSNVNITAPSNTFCVYNAQGVQIIDSNLGDPNKTTNTFTLFNADITVTNSAANPNLVTLGGLVEPGTNNTLAFFNGLETMGNPNVLGPNQILTVGGNTLTVSNGVNLGASTLNFAVGTNNTKIAATGNLTLGGTLNVTDGGGLTSGTYTLFTYGGTLTYNGLSIGPSSDPNFTYTVSTNTHGQVNLVVSNACPVGAAGPISGPASVNAGTSGVAYSISSVSGATTYAWTVPSGATIASGQGTTSITVNYACSATSGNVAVTPSSGGCSGAANSLTVTVTGVGAAGPITGSSSVDAGDGGLGYSISSVSGATTYTWTVPSGASIASGEGTTSITVNYSCSAVSGNVQVTPGNANGCTGTAGSLSVTVTGVGAAGAISGPTAVCADERARLFDFQRQRRDDLHVGRPVRSDNRQWSGQHVGLGQLGFDRR